MEKEIMLKVSTNSNPNSVAGAIVNFLKKSTEIEISTVGAGALNQAIKAIAIARGYVAPLGKNLICIPAFAELEVKGVIRTGIKLIVKESK